MADDIQNIDDEALAKGFIAGSPDVTNKDIQEGEGEENEAQQKNESAKPKNSIPEHDIDEEKARQDAEVVGRSINTGLSNFTGASLNDDQSAIISAFAREGFELLQASGLPKIFRFSILGIFAGLALLPVFLQIRGAKE